MFLIGLGATEASSSAADDGEADDGDKKSARGASQTQAAEEFCVPAASCQPPKSLFGVWGLALGSFLSTISPRTRDLVRGWRLRGMRG